MGFLLDMFLFISSLIFMVNSVRTIYAHHKEIADSLGIPHFIQYGILGVVSVAAGVLMSFLIFQSFFAAGYYLWFFTGLTSSLATAVLFLLAHEAENVRHVPKPRH